MPFDGKMTDFIVVPFNFDEATPDQRLIELARMLEDEQAWRDTQMEWDYCTTEGPSSNSCGTSGCAMGLARIAWLQFNRMVQESGYDAASSAAFNLNRDSLFGLFYGEYIAAPMVGTSPRMVATAIRQFVSNRTGS